jgi:3-methyladenine DNA glycosylase AlkC
VNHMEQMAMDMGALLKSTFPQLSDDADRLRSGGLVYKMRAGGQLLFEALGEAAWQVTANHRSDTVRGWGAMAIGSAPLSLCDQLDFIYPFADDSHFAVREWAWLSLRSAISLEPHQALDRLEDWADSESERVRRFASESTRPRGVWSAHIPALKEQPQSAAALLRTLREDPSPYVQNSVGNWLNDASKSRPDWVRATCERWLAELNAPATKRICARGMRTLNRL